MDHIIIYDNSIAANIVYVSESVYDVLGFTPEELVGLSGYEILHPDEMDSLLIFHTANLTDEPMSSLLTYQSKHKNGYYIKCDIIIHTCYDVMVCTNFKREPGDSARASMRALSADEAYVINEDGSLTHTNSKSSGKRYRIKSLFSEPTTPLNEDGPATERQTLNWDNMEPRFCLILNRYTKEATIVFASICCSKLVGLDQTACIGHSLFDFVADNDYLSVSNQLDLIKSQSTIAHFQFRWLCGLQEIPVDAVADASYDGIVMVVRLATDFVIPQS